MHDRERCRRQLSNACQEAVTSHWAEAYPKLADAAEHWRYQPATDSLTDKTILVTGAGDGIGATTAKTLACFGANVVLLGRTRQKLEAVFDWIEAHTETEPVIVPADLALIDEDSVGTLRDSIASTYGTLHGLINNASKLGPKVPLAHYPYGEWMDVMQTNVNAAFLLTKGLFDLLHESGDACVLNISSTVGHAGRAYWGAYSASKFALEGLSQILADETETAGHIRVYSINPGGTRTNMRAEAYPLEDPNSLPHAEAHMDLFLYLLEGARSGKDLPPTGSLIDCKTWDVNQ
jgi:NAD(P)-dependent dehydrogenase (short-subunit alcohol dehydrogenase family)